MKTIKIAIVGFGNVAKGFVQTLIEKDAFYSREYGLHFVITAITDIEKGSAYNSDGLPLSQLLESERIDTLKDCEHPDWNAMSLIRNSESDVLLELSYTNLKSGEPANLHMREAILSGKHVVTSNKGPIALHFRNLNLLAIENNVKIGFEGTVMSGTPALALGLTVLKSACVRCAEGIFNGTTNYILSEMESGISYGQALKQAQDLGFAEADPSGDVEGHDTAGKVAILSQLIFGVSLDPSEIERTGITQISLEDIQKAKDQNCRWKLIGNVRQLNGKISASVMPKMLPLENPLANVSGAVNAIQYETDLLGVVTLIGPGAGRIETAAGLIQDLITIFK